MLVPSSFHWIVHLFRRSAVPPAPLHQSLPEMASAALKPGMRTWLVARAVSLRAF